MENNNPSIFEWKKTNNDDISYVLNLTTLDLFLLENTTVGAIPCICPDLT